MKRLGEYQVSAKYRMRKFKQRLELEEYYKKMSILDKIRRKLKIK